jgi:hypothetical protein
MNHIERPRMLRRALGSTISAWREDPSVIEVMLNSRWPHLDRPADTGDFLAPIDGETIIHFVAHHVGTDVHEVHPGQPTRFSGTRLRNPQAASRHGSCF